MTDVKACTKCGTSKPKTDFCRDSRRSDGLKSWCKDCDNAANAAWYAANREKRRAVINAWNEANRDRVRATTAKWEAENPDRARERQAKWRAENREANRIIVQNRRSRENGGNLSKGLAEKLLKLQRGKCACGCNQALGDDYHLDHIMPLALGGSNTDDNIQLLRATCNMKKNAKHPVEFMQQQGFLL